MSKVSLNILGACVSRDIFGLNDEDGGYEIRQFLNFISPLTMFDEGVSIDENEIFSLVKEEICSQWELKCAYLDMTRGAYDYIKQKTSDYLVIDTALTRFDLNKFESGELCGCTNNKLFKFLEKNRICPKIKSVVPVCSLNENELREKMLIFAEKIREIYSPERIILLEVLNAEIYYNSIDGYLYTFERMVKYREKNKVIKFCFEVLRDALPGCHVVYMPKHVVADSFHKWGRGPMHYTMEFYKYGIEAIEIIVNNSSGGG